MVTGGNSGIGYALCEELQKRGAIVYMAGRNPAKVA
ncbi:MAG: SDR family NAD(P)-dependent oxidoreductase, partial [Methanoregula sp.]|nr:SDR family NAD(P)-dependent oxidoreductase [Methanoregula sp.]